MGQPGGSKAVQSVGNAVYIGTMEGYLWVPRFGDTHNFGGNGILKKLVRN